MAHRAVAAAYDGVIDKGFTCEQARCGAEADVAISLSIAGPTGWVIVRAHFCDEHSREWVSDEDFERHDARRSESAEEGA